MIASQFDEKIESEITCPYCDHEVEDSGSYESPGTIQCEECRRNFSFSREVIINYWCAPDCELNGREHEFKWWQIEDHSGAYLCSVCNKCKIQDTRHEQKDGER